MAKKIDVTEEEQGALLACVTALEQDDQFIRERNVRVWKKAEEYWRLNQFVYWDDVALDYRNISNYQSPTGTDDDNDSVVPKTFPIYRAYGESIIAAMSSSVPTTLFFPDDADNPDDVTTAKAYSTISELIQKHSKAPLLLIKILSLLYNQGLAATYVNWDDDEKHGIVKVPIFKNETIRLVQVTCPNCGNNLGDEPIQDTDIQNPPGYETTQSQSPEFGQMMNQNPGIQAAQQTQMPQPMNPNQQQQSQGDQFQGELTPEEQLEVAQEKPFEKIMKCDVCGYEGQPEIGKVFDETIPRLVDYSNVPKGRINIQAFGPLNVRISSYAKTQQDVGLLELQLEMHYAAARDEFPEIADKITPTSDLYSYERWGRTSSELLNDQVYHQATVRYCWVREWAFHVLDAKHRDKVDSLQKKFPHGCCVIFVNDIFAKAYDESMDDHWSLSYNPLDSFIHGIPMGRSGLDVQDAYNEVKKLSLQKHQFGIAETFVDSSILDEESYRQQMAGPGYVTFANGVPGRPMADAFFQTRTAAMNEEDMNLQQSLNTDAQFLSGAVPSIFGGANVTGSKTATEYNQSRNFALQRLSSHWTNVKYLWTDTMSKASRLFATKMVEDEKFVRKNANSFETVWIRKAELTGKIGNVEPDPSEQFPVNWAQKRDLFMQLITMPNPVISQIMMHPNNIQVTKDSLGLPEIAIPGEEDRVKQLLELRKLVQVDQQHIDPQQQQSTVPVDPDVDMHPVHIEVIKLWAVSPEGLFVKETNPAAYLNVILHLREHNMAMAPPPMPMPQPGPNQSQGNKPPLKMAPKKQAQNQPMGQGQPLPPMQG